MQPLCAAFKTVSNKNDCTCNDMIYDLEESNEETIEDEVGKIEDKPVISKSCNENGKQTLKKFAISLSRTIRLLVLIVIAVNVSD